MVLEKTLESPLDCKEFQPVHPKGDQSWVFFGRTDVEAETPILWPPDAKRGLMWKDPDAGKNWGQEEKGTTEDELVGWHHWLNGQGFGWTLGVGDGQGGLACCSSWSHRIGHDWATELNWFAYWASQVALVVKNLPANAGNLRDLSLIPGSGRFPWKRKWQPTPVFLPGESHGLRSLVDYNPWGLTWLSNRGHTHLPITYLPALFQN